MRWRELLARFAGWRRDRLLARGTYLIDLSLWWGEKKRKLQRVSKAEVNAELAADEDARLRR